MKQITSDALERPESERLSWLAEVCADDEELRLEVSSLLTAHAKAGEFLETPGIAKENAGWWRLGTAAELRPATFATDNAGSSRNSSS